MFYSTPSQFLWEDELGTVNHMPQGEGSEQGDSLMPLVSSCSLSTITSMSQPSQTVWWTSIIPWPPICGTRRELHQGKTVIWKKAGICPRGCHALEDAVRRADPNAVVWRGNVLLEPQLQDLVVLGFLSSSWPSWRPNLANTMFSSTGSHLWVTFSQPGVCSFLVLQPGALR